ncbi:MMPL family transporter [Actinoplanes couchii]|uniref:Membrane transport protein MMPL domain-containing protein n=1 Tax=Actinoplanes couchii TaxID=403638 RepID=A0ABQ3XM08_9ACTN|nr:MMPL family transporter [Actinoplanes couchii]MDR6319243.1 putative membrane protein YdfJ with MMPL/SSD domain [Actinoplanes couchii]GID59548.1 hypothetical protein Aco03nite_079520 [Actinoplanes couchii]
MFAGVTVIIALAGLSIVGIGFLTEMGLAAASTVAVAVLMSLTLLPAVIRVAGERIMPSRERKGLRQLTASLPNTTVIPVVGDITLQDDIEPCGTASAVPTTLTGAAVVDQGSGGSGFGL